MMLCKAYEFFKEPRYLQAAQAAGDTVWQRGLVKKGLGLCHGVSGNAYTFLMLFRATGDKVHLERALNFAYFGWHDPRLLEKLVKTPDSPYSLFEGIAGAVYFYHDLLLLGEGYTPAFPTFEGKLLSTC